MRQQKITVPTVGGNAGFTATQTYNYDSLNRISDATETISGSQTWKQAFTFDRYGNRRFDAANTTTIAGCGSAICNPTISTANNRFSTGQGYSYDSNGAITLDATGQRFSYDAESRQTQFFSASNSTGTPDATYSFDGDGKRVRKISATENTTFVYDAAGQLVEEYASGTVQTAYVYAGSSLLTTETATGTNYLTADHLGSPRIVTDGSGNVVSRKDYTAFGEETATSQRTTGLGYNPQNVRQDYTGYQKDNESGLEYSQARYYNPLHGRFTSVDPLTASATVRDPQTFNRYSYGLNSPYKFTDPLGLAAYNASWHCSNCSEGPGAGGVFSSALATGQSWSLSCWCVDTGYALGQPDGSLVINDIVIPAAFTGQTTRQGSEPPPIPVVVGWINWDVDFSLPILGAGNIGYEADQSITGVPQEQTFSNITQIPAKNAEMLDPVGSPMDYLVSFRLKSTGASLKGYSYEIKYGETPEKDEVKGRQTFGDNSDITIGTYRVARKIGNSSGYPSPVLTGDRSLDKSGMITIYSPTGGKIAESSFRATVTTLNAKQGEYSINIVESSRSTAFGSWNRPSH